MRIHQKEAKFTISGTKIHVKRVGEGEDSHFVCNICDLQFTVADRLKSHIETKHHDTQYPPRIG